MENIILVSRVLQILIHDGWLFIDNGSTKIEKVVNESLGETVYFKNATELESWIYEQAEILEIN